MYSNMKNYEHIYNSLRVTQQNKNRKLKSANCWQQTSLTHLSRQTHMVSLKFTFVLASVRCRRLPFPKIFPEIAWPIKAKFHVKPIWEGGTKVCLCSPGNMNKVAVTPIYVKNLQKSSPQEPDNSLGSKYF